MFPQKVTKSMILDTCPDIVNIVNKYAYVGNDAGTEIDCSLETTAFLLLYSRKLNEIQINVTKNEAWLGCDMDPEVYSFHFFDSHDFRRFLSYRAPGFEEPEPMPVHEKFLSDKLGVEVRIRLLRDYNTVFIYTSRITLPLLHAVQFFIPKYFNVFKENPITDAEKDFLQTLTLKHVDRYLDVLQKMTRTESFRKFVTMLFIVNLEKTMFKKKLNAASDQLSAIDTEMSNYLESYRKACQRRFDVLATLEGLKVMAEKKKTDTELQDYLLNNKHIRNVKINDTRIEFVVKTELVPYYVDDWMVLGSRLEYFNRFKSSVISNNADKKLVLDAIFGENPEFVLKLCAVFELDYFGSTVSSRQYYDFRKNVGPDFADCLPSPHLHYYNCFGQNAESILTCLKDGDMIGAIECSIMCAQRVNIHESATMDYFGKDILNASGKILIAKDGTEMTPLEALEYLKELHHG